MLLVISEYPLAELFAPTVSLSFARSVLVFAFSAYSANPDLGSPGKVYDLLMSAAAQHPVPGNEAGSYLTMRSQEGAVFFVINIVGNFGTSYSLDLPDPQSVYTRLPGRPP